MEEKGLLISKENKKDKRSELLILTSLGKQLMLEAYDDNAKLRETYRELVGDKNFKIAISHI